jgi:hypothetical protein
MYPQANTAPRYKKWAHQPIYNKKQRYTSCTTHGASIAPPPAPPLVGGDPPPPASGGGGPPTGPSCPGGRRPLVIAANTVARCTMARHGGGTPTHCSRKLSSWMRVHMPSGTSCNTVSRRRRISSKSTPTVVGGVCDGPAPGSSNRRLLAALSGSVGRPAASSYRHLSPCGSVSGSQRAGALCISTSRPQGATSAQAKNNNKR